VLYIERINDNIGAAYSIFIKIRYETIDDKKVCVVDTDKASEPAFQNGPRGKEFHVRMGNTTRILDSEETVSYIQRNWE